MTNKDMVPRPGPGPAPRSREAPAPRDPKRTAVGRLIDPNATGDLLDPADSPQLKPSLNRK